MFHMPTGIHHVDLPMADYGQTSAFYGDVLRWKIAGRFGRDKKTRQVVAIDKGRGSEVIPESLQIELEDGSYLFFIVGKEPDYSQDEPHLALKVRKAERMRILSSLKKANVTYESNIGENVAFYDPSGLRIELYEG